MSESGLLLPEDAHIELAPLLREYALLEIPINPLHDPDCRGLYPICGRDLNIRDCEHRPDGGDSPFAKIKDLLDELKIMTHPEINLLWVSHRFKSSLDADSR